MSQDTDDHSDNPYRPRKLNGRAARNYSASGA